MIELSWTLVPVLLGVVASPLAVIALVAVLLSRSARRNGVMYLIGWSCAVLVSVLLGYWLFGWLEVDRDAGPKPWVPYVRLAAGVLLAVGAVWTYRRSKAKIRLMATASSPEEIVAAAPQLPGWLHSIDSFTAQRSLALGLGIFLLNPINVSCALIAALDIRLAGLSGTASWVFLVAFMLLSIAPMAVPVFLVLAKGEKAEPFLAILRSWIAAHNGSLSTVFLGIIAFMQIQKALEALPWA